MPTGASAFSTPYHIRWKMEWAKTKHLDIASLVLTTAVVGPFAAPIIATAALVYGVSILFWGPGSD